MNLKGSKDIQIFILLIYCVPKSFSEMKTLIILLLRFISASIDIPN